MKVEQRQKPLRLAVCLGVCVGGGQVGAVRLFFTPEEGDDAQNHAKRHFLQTGESKEVQN